VKFDMISSTFSDEDKLDDIYTISVLVNRFRSHCAKFDMLDVFQIIYSNQISPDNQLVFLKTCWFTTPVLWRSKLNLQLSADLIKKNTTDVLWEKCIEAQDDYPIAQR
jgi:hypothetical protein